MSPALQTGRYEILENLGYGATCRVDKARDTVIGRTVALKSFLQGFGRNSEQQFLQEAQTIGRLSHGSIAQLYDVNTDAAGGAFLVMEFVSGKNLEQLLAQSPIPLADAAVWAADIASALSCAHRAGIIHGDVKPSNIRVTEDGKVKLVDFGVARFASQVSGSDRVLGTPAYLSPEQIEGKKQDGRSDLFRSESFCTKCLQASGRLQETRSATFARRFLLRIRFLHRSTIRSCPRRSTVFLRGALPRILMIATNPATTWHARSIWWRDAERSFHRSRSAHIGSCVPRIRAIFWPSLP